jgi:shikimate kinase
MTSTPTLVLMGLRVSGKTTLGKRIARDTGRRFVDIDDRVAVAAGVAHAADIIRERGLDAFRTLEAHALLAVLAERGIVLALGGGTPTAPGAEQLLRAVRDRGDAVLIYLHAEPGTLADRLRAIGSGSRPSLTGGDPAAEMHDVYADRHPLFADLASVTIDADEWDEDRLAAAVIDAANNADPAS